MDAVELLKSILKEPFGMPPIERMRIEKAIVKIQQLQAELAAKSKRIYTEEAMTAMVQERDYFCNQNLENYNKFEQIQTKNETLARLLLEVAEKMDDCPCGYREQMKIRAKQALKQG